MRIVILTALLSFPLLSLAMGNHPDSNNCTAEKPYQAICTHSSHSLEGWYGTCYATQAEAQAEADRHAQQQHGGNSRYTGVIKARIKP